MIGASTAGITAMLSRDFLTLVGIALLIAFPLSWWRMNNWLENYAYRVNMSSTIFIVAGAIVFLITLVAIGFQTIKAALAKPVFALRSE